MFKIFFLRYRDFGVDLFYHVFIRLANYFAPQYSSSVYITAKTFFRLALFRGGGGGVKGRDKIHRILVFVWNSNHGNRSNVTIVFTN